VIIFNPVSKYLFLSSRIDQHLCAWGLKFSFFFYLSLKGPVNVTCIFFFAKYMMYNLSIFENVYLNASKVIRYLSIFFSIRKITTV